MSSELAFAWGDCEDSTRLAIPLNDYKVIDWLNYINVGVSCVNVIFLFILAYV